MTTFPYQDPKLSTKERVTDLLGRMTTEEKVGQMLQLDARDGVESLIFEKHVGSILHTSPESVRQAHELVPQTRLQIPLLIAEDCIHGHSFWEGATIFPIQLGMAASWNPELVEEAARVTAVEASATGIHWTFSPLLCISRDPRWGRVGETFGEDPHLIGELASAMVRGYQGGGSKDPHAILACAKHFAGYSETQGGRDASEADISHRKMRSWFLPPFERVAREGVATFMLGYQTTDGIPITLNSWLLDDILRGEWNYPGVLVTDWDNVGRMVWEQKIQPDYAHAAVAAVRAGNDMIMATPRFFEGALEAIEAGMMEEAELDRAVSNILALKFELGLFENPRQPKVSQQQELIGAVSHRQTNEKLARESLVLLENDGLLPLPDKPIKIAVSGLLADDAQTQLGDWAGNSGQINWMPDGHPRELITTVVDALRNERNVELTYATGTRIVDEIPDPEGDTFPDGQPRPNIVVSAPLEEDLLTEAAENATAADVAVVVVGDVIPLVGEGRSTATLELMGGQNELLRRVIETGTPTVVVLMSSKPQILPKCVEDCAALIFAASPGMQGGNALADLLFGRIEPIGRLPISFPRHTGQIPVFYNQVRGQHGHRYADLTQEPAYAFGYGLGYTEAEYSNVSAIVDGTTVRATIDVKNTGSRKAVETVQLYVSDLVTSASWADSELKAFHRVELDPNESKTVEFDLPIHEMSIVNAKSERVVEPGEFEIRIGSSSRKQDQLTATVTLR